MELHTLLYCCKSDGYIISYPKKCKSAIKFQEKSKYILFSAFFMKKYGQKLKNVLLFGCIRLQLEVMTIGAVKNQIYYHI